MTDVEVPDVIIMIYLHSQCTAAFQFLFIDSDFCHTLDMLACL